MLMLIKVAWVGVSNLIILLFHVIIQTNLESESKTKVIIAFAQINEFKHESEKLIRNILV